MAETFSLSMNTSKVDKRLKEFQKKSPKALEAALSIAGIQFLTWANNGSSKESRKPPIRRGFLRGSSSAFLGGKLLGVYQLTSNQDVNRSHSDKPFTLTWGWNSNYATKMHETEYNLGRFSQQDGDAGNKWLEKHLSADRNLLMALTAEEFGKKVGTL